MQPYLRTRDHQEKNARLGGIVATAAIHVAVALVCIFTGLSYLDPPPPERTSLLIEFEPQEEDTRIYQTKAGRQPQAEEVDRTKEVELVQKADSPYTNPTPNTTPATKPDPHGDVEVPDPKVEEPALDPRASFPGMQQADNSSTTPHSATEASEGFKAGQPDGNTPQGKTEGTANAHVKGRTVVGTLPKPAYNAQMEGTVVVQIKVNREGNVFEAIPGADGTTVTDKYLWNAARKAAMGAHFSSNMSSDAPEVQIGTITYKFKLQ